LIKDLITIGNLLSTKFLKSCRWFYIIPCMWTWLPRYLNNKVLNNWWIVKWQGRPQNHEMCMIAKRNDISTTKGEWIITLFVIICGTIHVLKWMMVKVEHWN
jgi:hypothetical protein